MDNDQRAKLRQEYHALSHAMQTGVAFEQANGSDDGSAKHLRVGVNSAHVSQLALVNLLINKGVITEDEYLVSLVDAMRAEVDRYQARVNQKLGADHRVTLR